MSDEDTIVQDIRVIPPDEGPEAYLIVLAGSSVGRMFRLPEGDSVVGRSADADLRLEDEGVSRRHSILTRREGREVWLHDLGSTNGTFVNGRRVIDHRLTDGDKIQIGRTVILKFSYQDHLDEQFQRELYEGAVRDGLTRLYNRRYLRDRLATEFAYSLRHEAPLALMLCDVDHFKRINDTFGHPAGDFVLEAVARRLSSAVRRDDVLARYGGEEFAVLCRETGRDQAIVFAERLRRVIESAPFSAADAELRVTLSIGVSVLRNRSHADPEALLRAVDRCLYRAKEHGRNCVYYEHDGLFESGVRHEIE